MIIENNEIKEVMEFIFESTTVRYLTDKNGDLWFLANEVMELLGIKHRAHALRKLDDDQRGEVILHPSTPNRKYAIVSESGLYTLTLQSRKEIAKRFTKYVTSVVLPKIRKGEISTNKQEQRSITHTPPISSMDLLDQLDFHLKMLRQQQEENTRQLELAKKQEVTNRIITKELILQGENQRHVAKTVVDLLQSSNQETVRVKNIETTLTAVVKTEGEGKLTNPQVIEILRLIKEKVTQYGNWGKLHGVVKKKIKERFLPKGYLSDFKFSDCPKSLYPQICEFVRTLVLTPNEVERARRKHFEDEAKKSKKNKVETFLMK